MKNKTVSVVVVVLVLFLMSGSYAADKVGNAKKGQAIKDSQTITAVQTTQPVESAPIESQAIPLNSVKSSAGEEINWQVLSGGGITNSSGSGYRLGGTIGQLAAGYSTDATHGLNHGFWQNFDFSPCDCFPGDANSDVVIDVGDAVYIINFVFRGGATAIPYPVCSGDAQADCFCNVGDAVYIINYVFRHGAYTLSCEEWRANCGDVFFKEGGK